MRILIGHQNVPLPPYDTDRYDVRIVERDRDGQKPPASIAEMLEQCPPGWEPDVYYHYAGVHFPIPTDIEAFNGLTVTDVQDWHRGGRALWAGAGFFDLILTERNACALLEKGGHENVVFARFWGVDADFHRLLPDVERDIDVLFIGSLNPEIWGERNRWLDRLAQLSERYRIVIAGGHYGEDYVRMTNRAKIVFNRSVNGCTNGRAYDAVACGALVFNEAENDETHEIFDDGVHCVYYDADNLEDRLEYYLTHEDERRRIVEAGRQKVVADHTFTRHTNALFALMETHRDGTGYRPAARLPRAERCWRKAMQLYAGTYPAAAETALALLDQAEQSGFEAGRLLQARAALRGWVAQFLPTADKVRLLTEALTFAHQSVRRIPNNVVAQMTLACLLLERAEATQGASPTGRNDVAEAVVALSIAAERCEAALTKETDPAGSDVDGFCYPRRADLFDSCVERAYLLRSVDEAAWARELHAVLAWRCRSLLSDLAAANGRHEEAFRQADAAAAVLPQEADSLLRLARCEAMTGQLDASVDHYRSGLAISPLTHAAWPELAAVLAATGRREEAEAFVAERLRTVRAIPGLAAIRPLLKAALQTA